MLFESSDIASYQTVNSGHELSNPSSSAGFNFIYTSGGWITWKTFIRNNKRLCSVITFPIRCSGTSRKDIMISTNQAFIEFQTRAIFIFEQSQVGYARSELRPGSSPLCAIRATVVSTRYSPLLTGWSLSHPPFPSFSPPLPLGFSPDDAALSGISPETDAARGHGVLLRVHISLSFSSFVSRHAGILLNARFTMSSKENNEVAVEKVTENDKASGDAKCEIKGMKRPAEEKNDETKKQKKEENGDGEVEEEEIEEEVEEEEEVDGDGEEDDEDDDIPEGEEDLEEGEDEEEDDAEGELEGEVEDEEEDA